MVAVVVAVVSGMFMIRLSLVMFLMLYVTGVAVRADASDHRFDQDKRVDSMVDEACQLYRCCKVAEAAELMRQAALMEPEGFYRHTLFGRAARWHTNWQTAILEYKLALRYNPCAWECYLDMACCFEKLGDWDAAIECYVCVQFEDPEQDGELIEGRIRELELEKKVDALESKARRLVVENKLAEANKTFARAASLIYECPDRHRWLVYSDLCEGTAQALEKAKDELEILLGDSPGSSEYQTAMQTVCLRLGKVEEARKWQAVLESYPDMRSISEEVRECVWSKENPLWLPEAAGGRGAGLWTTHAKNESLPVVRVWCAGYYRADPNNRFWFLKALDAWKQASGGRLQFVLVTDKSQADLTCRWTDVRRDLYPYGHELETLGQTTFNWCSDQPDPENGRRYRAAHILMYTRPWEGYRAVFSPEESVYLVALHEIGHALGLRSHSADALDVMGLPILVYPARLSGNDRKRLNELLDSVEDAGSKSLRLNEQAVELNNKAVSAIEHHMFRLAIKRLQMALEIDPSFYTARDNLAFAYSALACCCIDRGCYQDGERYVALSRSVPCSSSHLSCKFNNYGSIELARSWMERGEYDRAEKICRDIFASCPDDEPGIKWMALENSMLASLYMGDNESAEKTFDQLLDLKAGMLAFGPQMIAEEWNDLAFELRSRNSVGFSNWLEVKSRLLLESSCNEKTAG